MDLGEVGTSRPDRVQPPLAAGFNRRQRRCRVPEQVPRGLVSTRSEVRHRAGGGDDASGD